VSTDDETAALRSQCVDLLFECPRNSSVHDCPFRKVREQDDVVEQVNWLKGLPVETLRQLAEQHEQCCRRPRGVKQV
jgi:hypothetical protein